MPSFLLRASSTNKWHNNQYVIIAEWPALTNRISMGHTIEIRKAASQYVLQTKQNCRQQQLSGVIKGLFFLVRPLDGQRQEVMIKWQWY